MEYLKASHPDGPGLNLRVTYTSRSQATGALSWERRAPARHLHYLRTSAPRLTRSMRIAVHDLKLERLFVIHAASTFSPLAENIIVVPIPRIADIQSHQPQLPPARVAAAKESPPKHIAPPLNVESRRINV